MITKKDVVIAIMATFRLTATLFMITTSKSEYDPRLDTNDDGYINAKDAILLGKWFNWLQMRPP